MFICEFSLSIFEYLLSGNPLQAGWYHSVHLHFLLLLLHSPHRHRPLLLHRPPHWQPDFHQAGAVEQFSMDIFHIFEYYFRFLFQALFLSAIALLTSASISSPLLFLTELEVKIILAENTARTSRNWRWKLSIQMLTNNLPKKLKPLKLSNLFGQKTIS